MVVVAVAVEAIHPAAPRARQPLQARVARARVVAGGVLPIPKEKRCDGRCFSGAHLAPPRLEVGAAAATSEGERCHVLVHRRRKVIIRVRLVRLCAAGLEPAAIILAPSIEGVQEATSGALLRTDSSGSLARSLAGGRAIRYAPAYSSVDNCHDVFIIVAPNALNVTVALAMFRECCECHRVSRALEAPASDVVPALHAVHVGYLTASPW